MARTLDNGNKAPSRYSRMHYELVAHVLKMVWGNIEDNGAHVALAVVAAEFANTFRFDNAAFDVERFHEACGFKE